jgi:hypothetical protein
MCVSMVGAVCAGLVAIFMLAGKVRNLASPQHVRGMSCQYLITFRFLSNCMKIGNLIQ